MSAQTGVSRKEFTALAKDVSELRSDIAALVKALGTDASPAITKPKARKAATKSVKASSKKTAKPASPTNPDSLCKAARKDMRASVNAKGLAYGKKGNVLFDGKMSSQTPAVKAAARKWLKAHGYTVKAATVLGF